MRKNVVLIFSLLVLLSTCTFVNAFKVDKVATSLVEYSETESEYMLNATYFGNFSFRAYSSNQNDFSNSQSIGTVSCIDGENNCFLKWSVLDKNKTIYYWTIFENETSTYRINDSFTTYSLDEFNVTGITPNSANFSYSGNKEGNYVLKYEDSTGTHSDESRFTLSSHTFTIQDLLVGTRYFYKLYYNDVVVSSGSFVTSSVGDINVFEITKPLNGSLFNTSKIILAGMTEVGAQITVERNNEVIKRFLANETTGGFYTNITLSCSKGGKNFLEIFVTKTNPVWAQSKKNITVYCDTESPYLDIHTDRTTINNATIKLLFGVEEDLTLDVWYNKTTNNNKSYFFGSYDVNLNESFDYASFNMTIDVNNDNLDLAHGNSITGNFINEPGHEYDGIYILYFKVSDKAGNSRIYNKTINIDSSIPKVVIDDIEQETTKSEMIFSGETEAGAYIKIVNLENESYFFYDKEKRTYMTCNDPSGNCETYEETQGKAKTNLFSEVFGVIFEREFKVGDDGKFNIPVKLVEGQNKIAITVRDDAGNTISINDHSNKCEINKMTGCQIEINAIGSNDNFYIEDSGVFPQVVTLDILSSTDKLVRSGTINVKLGTRNIDPSNIIYINPHATPLGKHSEWIDKDLTTNTFFDGINWNVVIEFSFKPTDFVLGNFTGEELSGKFWELFDPTSGTMEFEVLLGFDGSSKDGFEFDTDPIPISVAIDIQEPSRWLSDKAINKVINVIDKIKNVTKPIEEVSMTTAKINLGVCAGVTAWTTIKTSTGNAKADDLKKLYATCDRVACPYVPPKCDLNDGVKIHGGNKFSANTPDGGNLNYYIFDDVNKIDLSEFQDYCKKACGGRTNVHCIIREKNDQDTTPLITGAVLDFESVSGDYSVSCPDKKPVIDPETGEPKKDEFEDPKELLTSGDYTISTSCYSDKAPAFHQYACLSNTWTDGKFNGRNPADNLFTSVGCACTTGFYKHMENWNLLLDNTKECLLDVKSGELEGNFCRDLMSQYFCDLMYSAINKFRNGEGAFKQEERSGGQYPLDHVKNLNSHVGKRYQDTISDPQTGFMRNDLTYAACISAFKGEWETFDAALEEQIKQQDVKPTVFLPKALSRFLAPDYIEGTVSIYYRVSPYIQSGGSPVKFNITYYCDLNEPNADNCLNTYSGEGAPLVDFGNGIYSYSGVVGEDITYDDSIEINTKTSKGWANMVKLDYEYSIGGVTYKKTLRKQVQHHGKRPFECEMGLNIAKNGGVFSCTTLGDPNIGGTVYLKSVDLSPNDGGTFYPGDEVNVKLSFEDKMYQNDNFIVKYELDGPSAKTSFKGDDYYVNLKASEFLRTGTQDVNLHIFDLKYDEKTNIFPVNYQEDLWNLYYEERNDNKGGAQAVNKNLDLMNVDSEDERTFVFQTDPQYNIDEVIYTYKEKEAESNTDICTGTSTDGSIECKAGKDRVITSFLLKVKDAKGTISVKVSKKYNPTDTTENVNEVFSFVFNANNINQKLPPDIIPGTYTLKMTMYRNNGESGFNRGEDTLLSSNYQNQTEEISFVISDIEHKYDRPKLDVIFPPKSGGTISCNKGEGLNIFFNANNIKDTVDMTLSIKSDSYVTELKSTLTKNDKISTDKNRINVDRGMYGLYLEPKFLNSISTDSGKITFSLKLTNTDSEDEDNKEETSDSFSVYIGESGSNCNFDVLTGKGKVIDLSSAEKENTFDYKKDAPNVCLESENTVYGYDKEYNDFNTDICKDYKNDFRNQCTTESPICYVESCGEDGFKMNLALCNKLSLTHTYIGSTNCCEKDKEN